MSNQTPNATELFQSAAQSGDLSPGSAAILSGLSNRINKTMSTLAVNTSVTELLQVCMLLDNTPSMEQNKNHLSVIEGHNLVVDALLNARGIDSVETLTMTINPCPRYALRITGDTDSFRWCALKAAPRLDKTGYIHGTSTPLYDRVLETLGSVVARTKWWEDLYGVQTRSVTLIMTDGGDNDSKSCATDVARVVSDMLTCEKHRIFFMGVTTNGADDFRRIGKDIGLPDECIDEVERDPKAIRGRFQMFSQSAIALSGATATTARGIVQPFGAA